MLLIFGLVLYFLTSRKSPPEEAQDESRELHYFGDNY